MTLPALKVTTGGDGRRIVHIGDVVMTGVSSVSVYTHDDGTIAASLTIPVATADIQRTPADVSVQHAAADIEPPEMRSFGDPLPTTPHILHRGEEVTHA